MGFVEAFDHFVVPVDDLVAAEEFYTRVFDCPIVGRNGLNVAHRKRGAVPHTFMQIAGKRMGVYLQSEERPTPQGVHSAPTYSFETTDRGLEDTMADLETLDADFEGPVGHDRAFAASSIHFNDPAGNHYHVYVPDPAPGNQPSPEPPSPFRGGDGGEFVPPRMVNVGYLELEAPELESSV